MLYPPKLGWSKKKKGSILQKKVRLVRILICTNLMQELNLQCLLFLRLEI